MVTIEGWAEHKDFDRVTARRERRGRDCKVESVVRPGGGPSRDQVRAGLTGPLAGLELPVDKELDFEWRARMLRIEGPPGDPLRKGEVDCPTNERMKIGPGGVAGHGRQQQQLERKLARNRQKESC